MTEMYQSGELQQLLSGGKNAAAQT